MPPKRGRPARAAVAQAPPTKPTKRTKRLTTTNSKPTSRSDHSAQNDAEILSTFRLFAIAQPDRVEESDEAFDDDGEGLLKIADVRRCLSALNLPKPPTDFFDDPDQTYISCADFLALAQTLRDSASPAHSVGEDEEYTHDHNDDDKQAEEVLHAFALFTHDRSGSNVRITLADLKRVARELREDVDEAVLRLMIEEANGEQGRDSVGRGVGREDFEEVMKRAGVFG